MIHARDHPRTCGEKAVLSVPVAEAVGSPPHMRGKARKQSPFPEFGRITPAHAGKRPKQHIKPREKKDHPRTCGEKFGRSSLGFFLRGSPPHMRGKASQKQAGQAPRRITPAHAGKRLHDTGKRSSKKDHPRTCGEKLILSRNLTCSWGSPPHMRGKVASVRRAFVASGITPAHAGKRSYTSFSYLSIGDHPRTCGEKWYSYIWHSNG